MKHNEMKSKTQQPKNIKDVFTEHQKFNLITHRMQSSIASTGDKGKGRAIERNNTPNIFLVQNKGKGPPGRQRSPGAIKSIRFPKPVRFSHTNSINSEFHSLPSKFSLSKTNSNDFEIVTNSKNDDYKKYKFYFIQLLNSITMKKQIFILILAVFASVTVAFGQGAVHDSNPNTFSCANDALHPIAGKPYGYQLTGSPSGGQYTWYATKATTFVSTTASVTTLNTTGMLTSPTITAGANYGTTGAGDIVTITWSSAALANTVYNTNPTFVVGYYNSNGVAGICADNLKIYQLDPKNGFIVDIKAFDDASLATSLAYGANSETQCFDKVRDARWSTTQVLYDYGTNVLAYEVVAANFSEEWKPQFQLTGYDAATQSVTIQWTYDKPSTWGGSTAWHADTETATTNVADTSVGVSIYVRVTVDNNNYQGIADQALTLAVAGTNKEGLWDVDNTACTQPTSFATASVDDTVIQTLLKRPTISVGTTSSQGPNTTVTNSNAVPQP